MNYGMAAGRLWENAIAVAAVAAGLAGEAGADPRCAHAVGLLRSLGKVVLNNQPQGVRYPGEEAEPDVQAWEKAMSGFSSAEIAAVLLDHWRFPPEMVQALCLHRTPEANGEFAASAARLHLACGVAAEWGVHLPGEKAGWRSDEPMLAIAGVSQDQLTAAAERARAEFAKSAMIEWSHAA